MFVLQRFNSAPYPESKSEWMNLFVISSIFDLIILASFWYLTKRMESAITSAMIWMIPEVALYLQTQTSSKFVETVELRSGLSKALLYKL